LNLLLVRTTGIDQSTKRKIDGGLGCKSVIQVNYHQCHSSPAIWQSEKIKQLLSVLNNNQSRSGQQ